MGMAVTSRVCMKIVCKVSFQGKLYQNWSGLLSSWEKRESESASKTMTIIMKEMVTTMVTRMLTRMVTVMRMTTMIRVSSCRMWLLHTCYYWTGPRPPVPCFCCWPALWFIQFNLCIYLLVLFNYFVHLQTCHWTGPRPHVSCCCWPAFWYHDLSNLNFAFFQSPKLCSVAKNCNFWPRHL